MSIVRNVQRGGTARGLILACLVLALAVTPAWAKPTATDDDESRTHAGPRIPGMMPVVGRNLTYVVKPGEDLYTLGLRYGLAIEHLMWANGLTSNNVPAGKKITIPLMHVLPMVLDEGLVINLPERGVYLFKNREMIGFYPCAIGMGGRFATPMGDATIVNLQRHPTWFPPEWAGVKEPVTPGPGNPLGDRWIGLSLSGVGLHGTNQPMSVGQAASHGCMRMYPHLVRKLFEQVRVGMPVKVIYETVKVGFSPEDRKMFVQAYPDVYSRQPGALQALQERLEKSGLTEFIDPDVLQAALGHRNGLPYRLLGDDIVIKVNGRKVVPAFAPFVREGQIWTSSDFLKEIGAQATLNPEKELVITRDAEEVRFGSQDVRDLDDPGARVLPFKPRVWNGKSIIPVKPVLAAFNMTFKWVPQHKTLLIYCKDMDATL